MRNLTLLERQIELLELLAAPTLIFGNDAGGSNVVEKSVLYGMSIGRLRIEAEMSYRKRIGKIEKLLKHTFKHLGSARHQMLRDFVTEHPPRTYLRYSDALSFYEFLQARWQDSLPNPPYVIDLARLELAIARVRSFRQAEHQNVGAELRGKQGMFIRLSPSAEILQLNFDLRYILAGQDRYVVRRRDTFVLIVALADRHAPYVVNIDQRMAQMLGDLRSWKTFEAAYSDSRHGSNVREKLNLLSELEVLQVYLR
jgi:hypothetical protein